MLVQEGDDAAVLAGAEFVEAVDGQHQIAFGNLESRLELPGVLNLVDVDLGRAADRRARVFAPLSR